MLIDLPGCVGTRSVLNQVVFENVVKNSIDVQITNFFLCTTKGCDKDQVR